MIRRLLLLAIGLILVLAAGWIYLMREVAIEHGDRMQLEGDLFDAANGPGGPDYQREIALYRSRLPDSDDRKLSIAAATLSACAAKRPPCAANPVGTEAEARAQLDQLAKTSSSTDVRSGAKRWLAEPERVVGSRQSP